jgi:hypothetical protein
MSYAVAGVQAQWIVDDHEHQPTGIEHEALTRFPGSVYAAMSPAAPGQ